MAWGGDRDAPGPGCSAAGSAECAAYDRPVDRTLTIGHAFIATVVDASGETDPPHEDSAPFGWHVALRIDRILAGEVPEELVFNGWGVGCHSVRGNRLETGDRWQCASRVVGVEDFPPDEFPLNRITASPGLLRWIILLAAGLVGLLTGVRRVAGRGPADA